MALDEGREGPGLPRRDVAAETVATAGRVDPARLARPKSAGLAAAAAGLPSRLRAAGLDGRAEGQLLLCARRTVQGLQGRGGYEERSQQRRQQQGRQPAAAQQGPHAVHVAGEGSHLSGVGVLVPVESVTKCPAYVTGTRIPVSLHFVEVLFIYFKKIHG